MHPLKKESLVALPETHVMLTELPGVILDALNQVDFTVFGATRTEQLPAQLTLTLWTQTILEMQRAILSDLKGVTLEDKQRFAQAFETALADFIVHPDHGMTHAYFVYSGMRYLHELETGRDPDENVDIELQMLALLHDAFQSLPYQVAGEKCGIVSKVQKNDHARIVAKLLRVFGKKFGLPESKIAELSFALETHDSSYEGEIYPDEMPFTGALLHDSDKLFGASSNTHPQKLARGLFFRNAVANYSSSGAYLVRNLDPDYRSKITYGDRCYSDGFSLALAEVSFPMYTQSAQTIAAERRKYALQELLSVYELIFDTTQTQIEKTILPNLNTPSLQMFADALGHEPNRIETITTPSEFQAAILQLYDTVLTLPKEYHRNSYVTPNDSRGWKIVVFFGKQKFTIDPSIARFCFAPNGKADFLQLVEQAFLDVVPQEED